MPSKTLYYDFIISFLAAFGGSPNLVDYHSSQQHVPRQRTLTIRGRRNTVQLKSCLTSLYLTIQVKLLFINISKSAENKQNKQEVSRALILLLS